MRPQASKAAEPVKEESVTQAQPKLHRGAKWHGTINGVEGNYISDGSKLVPLDSNEGEASTEALRKESGTVVRENRPGGGAAVPKGTGGTCDWRKCGTFKHGRFRQLSLFASSLDDLFIFRRAGFG